MQAVRLCEVCQTPCDASDLQRSRCNRCAATLTSHTTSFVQNNFVFVDQNDQAAARSQRAALRGSQRRAVFPLDTSLLETNQDRLEPLAPPIPFNLDDRVIERFFSRWSEGQTTLGCLASMPALLEIAGPHSAMQTAILAVAYADLAVFERIGDRGVKAYQAYCTSLQRLQNELDDTSFVASDGYLATVLTVDAFELLYMSRDEPLGIHTQAIARLLELRQGSTVEQEAGRTLWRSAHQRIHVRPLFCDLPQLEFANLSVSTAVNDTGTRNQTLDIVAKACQAMSTLKQERARRPVAADLDKITRLYTTLRDILREAQYWSEHISSVSQSTRVAFDVRLSMELNQVFPMSTVVTYNNLRLARDQLYLGFCIIKALDAIVALRPQDFSNDFRTDPGNADTARDFLLAAQPDMILMQDTCRSLLDSIPLLIGLVDSNGTTRATPWSLVDTGVITVKSPLRTIANMTYLSPHMKREAAGVVAFIDTHRHVVYRP